MGRPKPLLPWRGITLIQYQVRELRAAGVSDVVVVLGHAADEVRPLVPAGARVVVNESYREGRASSLRTGAAALPDAANPIIVLNVDQPRPREVLSALLEEQRGRGAVATIPVAEGRRGHPPALSGKLLPELREASEDVQGLRGIIAEHEADVHETDLSSPIVLLGFNTPEEYEEALARYATPDPKS